MASNEAATDRAGGGMREQLEWMEAHGIEVLITDLPQGIAAQYHVRQDQLVVADDLDEPGMVSVLSKARSVITARLNRRVKT